MLATDAHCPVSSSTLSNRLGFGQHEHKRDSPMKLTPLSTLLGSLLLTGMPAQSTPTHFGANHPFGLEDLPHGRLRIV